MLYILGPTFERKSVIMKYLLQIYSFLYINGEEIYKCVIITYMKNILENLRWNQMSTLCLPTIGGIMFF